jgi:hypothetical protein
MRSRLQLLWLLVTLVYAGIRIALASRYLAGYGLSIPVFAVIELASSALFGFASGRLVPALADRTMPGKHTKQSINWGAATLVGFAAPDAFVFATTRSVPFQTLLVLIIFVTGSLTFSSVSLRRRVLAEQRASAMSQTTMGQTTVGQTTVGQTTVGQKTVGDQG